MAAATVIDRIVVDALQVPAEFSGVGRQAMAIGEQLSDLPAGLALEVRCARDARGRLEPAFPPGTRFRTPLRRSRPRLLRILVQQLVSPLRDGRTTLVVCLGDQAPLVGRARVLLVVNDLRRLTGSDAGRLERAWYRFLVPRAVRRADTVATISEFSRAEIERVLHPASPVPVVVQSPPPLAAEPRRAGRGAPFLVVSALRPYKGVETAIDAVALVDGAALVVAGPDEGSGAALAARATGKRVRILGWVPDDELEARYESALATVHPSAYEGYGLGLAESLARALPAVASDIPAHREVGGDAVLYFPPGDVEALAARLREVVERRDELAARALARSRELQAGLSWREAILAAAR